MCVRRKYNASAITESWGVIEYDRVLVNYIEREKGGGAKKELIWKPRQEARGIDWRSNNASQRALIGGARLGDEAID